MHDAILEALRRGATAEALALARDWVAEAPEDAQAHRWLAVTQTQAGDHEGALESIDRAIALAPDEAELHLVRGSVLLGVRRMDDAQVALAKATGLDPNQLGAYFLQAQMALARGDVDEAERIATLAARIAPDHPQLAAIRGMVALRRGDAAGAVTLLNAAVAEGGEEPQVYYALGFAYLAQGHRAFAEQAFAKVLELLPSANGLRGIIADLMATQGRPAEALDMLRPLLERPDPGFLLQRLAGELEMAAGRPGRALPWLRAAFEARPRDPQVLTTLVEAWKAIGQAPPAREALDAALAVHPDEPRLWEARLVFTRQEDAREVVDRWLAAMPDHPAALEVLATLQDLAGDDAAIETTRRVVELEPGRLVSELRLAWLEQREDPPAAIARLQRLVDHHEAPGVRAQLRAQLGLAQDKAGRFEDAIATWTALHADRLPQSLARPTFVPAPAEWPPLGEVADAEAPAIALLWGPPGSAVDQLVEQATRAGLPILRDRFGENPPRDPLQRADTGARLAGGELTPEAVVDRWREALPGRGHAGGPLIDRLPWWDNALLLALRPRLPGALLLLALRDPRDMLLDWLAFGGTVPLALESPQAGAHWLAGMLDQVATLREQDLYPHRLVRLDDAIENPAALTDALNVALDIDLPPPPPSLPSTLQRLPAGHWRKYDGVLGEAFAVLAPVAERLGYPRA
ncbi:MAG TPA: tetratricopeptide repeat protein [Xanthomonadaceae bacterium]|nr:tetratricopeptide repeat protein [Xanthomonadaceae bacterium]